MPVPAEYQQATKQFTDFLVDVRDNAGLWSTHAAYTMTQGVLLAFRRRVSTQEALDFANLLPVGLRALFVLDWKIDAEMVPFESREKMTDEVKSLRANHNFSPDSAISDVAMALRRHVDPRALDEYLAKLSDCGRDFWKTE